MSRAFASRPPRDSGRAPVLPEPPASAAPASRRSGAQAGLSPTHKQLPAVSQPSPTSYSYVFDADEDPITEVSRSTDFGEPPPEPSTKNCALLLRLDGVHAGQVIPLTGEALTLGRHPSNDVVLVDAGVSRFHARLERAGGGFRVVDLDSRNGTHVRGTRVEHGDLDEGDWLQLGPGVSFRFVVTDPQHQGLLMQLYESSTRDALTGTYNRRHLDERLRSELAYAARHGNDVAIVLFDLDHFKNINDTLGHPAGDAVLRQVARAAQRTLRTEDVLARFGGEEFVVLMRGARVEDAHRLGERLRATIAALGALVDDRTLSVTISAGCAAASETEHRTPEELLELADARLYCAKGAGRNRVVAAR